MVGRRGEVWWADLPRPTGSGPGYPRPVLVVQSDLFNESGISTVVVAVLTANARLAQARGNVLVSRRDSGLSKPSVVNVSQILTLDRRLLRERVSMLPAAVLSHIESGLRLLLSL